MSSQLIVESLCEDVVLHIRLVKLLQKFEDNLDTCALFFLVVALNDGVTPSFETLVFEMDALNRMLHKSKVNPLIELEARSEPTTPIAEIINFNIISEYRSRFLKTVADVILNVEQSLNATNLNDVYTINLSQMCILMPMIKQWAQHNMLVRRFQKTSTFPTFWGANKDALLKGEYSFVGSHEISCGAPYLYVACLHLYYICFDGNLFPNLTKKVTPNILPVLSKHVYGYDVIKQTFEELYNLKGNGSLDYRVYNWFFDPTSTIREARAIEQKYSRFDVHSCFLSNENNISFHKVNYDVNLTMRSSEDDDSTLEIENANLVYRSNGRAQIMPLIKTFTSENMYLDENQSLSFYCDARRVILPSLTLFSNFIDSIEVETGEYFKNSKYLLLSTTRTLMSAFAEFRDIENDLESVLLSFRNFCCELASVYNDAGFDGAIQNINLENIIKFISRIHIAVVFRCIAFDTNTVNVGWVLKSEGTEMIKAVSKLTSVLLCVNNYYTRMVNQKDTIVEKLLWLSNCSTSTIINTMTFSDICLTPDDGDTVCKVFYEFELNSFDGSTFEEVPVDRTVDQYNRLCLFNKALIQRHIVPDNLDRLQQLYVNNMMVGRERYMELIKPSYSNDDEGKKQMFQDAEEDFLNDSESVSVVQNQQSITIYNNQISAEDVSSLFWKKYKISTKREAVETETKTKKKKAAR